MINEINGDESDQRMKGETMIIHIHLLLPNDAKNTEMHRRNLDIAHVESDHSPSTCV